MSRFTTAVHEAGYQGWTEVEVFHADVWARPGAEVLDEAYAGYRAAVS
jgi:sugar phosphate isomerase/epimerase